MLVPLLISVLANLKTTHASASAYMMVASVFKPPLAPPFHVLKNIVYSTTTSYMSQVFVRETEPLAMLCFGKLTFTFSIILNLVPMLP